MNEKYAEPIIRIVALQPADIVTVSIEKGDNTIEDGFFD